MPLTSDTCCSVSLLTPPWIRKPDHFIWHTLPFPLNSSSLAQPVQSDSEESNTAMVILKPWPPSPNLRKLLYQEDAGEGTPDLLDWMTNELTAVSSQDSTVSVLQATQRVSTAEQSPLLSRNVI